MRERAQHQHRYSTDGSLPACASSFLFLFFFPFFYFSFFFRLSLFLFLFVFSPLDQLGGETETETEERRTQSDKRGGGHRGVLTRARTPFPDPESHVLQETTTIMFPGNGQLKVLGEGRRGRR